MVCGLRNWLVTITSFDTFLLPFYWPTTWPRNNRLQLGPVHTNPFSDENGAVLLRIRLSSTLQRRKRSPKTEPFENALKVERFENDAFWKRCFLLWTEKTMLSENGDVIKIDTTGRQTTRPWVSKMADRRYHVVSISRQIRGPIYWIAHASSSFEHAH